MRQNVALPANRRAVGVPPAMSPTDPFAGVIAKVEADRKRKKKQIKVLRELADELEKSLGD